MRFAVALRPAEAAGHDNLAVTLQARDEPEEALAVLDVAVGLAPGDAEIQHHRAMLLLRLGRLREGWDCYEWRLRTRAIGRGYERFAGQTPWRGEALEGRTILLVGEQGFGDVIQFARYAPLVAARGGWVIMSVHAELMGLLRGLGGVARLLPAGEAVPEYGFHCPLLSLPRAFGTTLESVPAEVPYLCGEAGAVARWRKRVGGGTHGLRAGIVWAGNPNHVNDRQRSVPFAALAPLWQAPGVRWFGLQTGPRAADPSAAGVGAGQLENLAGELTDFAETAAAISALDLVIAVDTAVAHLAGALGKPVWLLLPFMADWRWLRTGETSPWYPTMRLFRQGEDRRWEPVIGAVAEALRAEGNRSDGGGLGSSSRKAESQSAQRRDAAGVDEQG